MGVAASADQNRRDSDMEEMKMMADSETYQLIQPLLSIEIDSTGERRLARLPTTSILKRTTTASTTPGFVEVVWQDRRYLVFEQDLEKQRPVSDPLPDANANASVHPSTPINSALRSPRPRHQRLSRSSQPAS
jgi:hypothetical protein